MARTSSPRVQNSPGCIALRAMYQTLLQTSPAPTRWTEVEAAFLRAMWAFDQDFACGRANQGDNQNGKGDFFTDVIAQLLESCSGKTLHGRGAVPGLIFPVHALDASYPEKGVVEVLVETKAAGAPKTPRNPRQKHPLGRAGSADLDKRVKEAGLKTIDLKAEWARNAGRGGGPTGDLVTWLKRSKPASFLFMAIRVVDANDLERSIRFANAANQMMDGVGLIAYMPDASRKAYVPQKVDTHLELDRTLTRVCTTLRQLP